MERTSDPVRDAPHADCICRLSLVQGDQTSKASARQLLLAQAVPVHGAVDNVGAALGFLEGDEGHFGVGETHRHDELCFVFEAEGGSEPLAEGGGEDALLVAADAVVGVLGDEGVELFGETSTSGSLELGPANVVGDGTEAMFGGGRDVGRRRRREVGDGVVKFDVGFGVFGGTRTRVGNDDGRDGLGRGRGRHCEWQKII